MMCPGSSARARSAPNSVVSNGDARTTFQLPLVPLRCGLG
jgi:hypothetical protein